MADPPFDLLDAVGDPGLRATLLFVRSQPSPQSADDVAAALAVHRTVARSRLERLLRAGLLVASSERRTGRSGPGAGRPAKVYVPAPELSAIEFPQRRYDRLVAALVDEIEPAAGEAALHRIGGAFSAELARQSGLRPRQALPAAAAELCAALGRLGFQAAVESADGSEVVLATPTCPLRPLVQASERAAELDRGVWAGLLAAALRSGAAAGIECGTRGCTEPGSACTVRLSLRG
jgi:predicted ArsR family transcriptional regulator